MGEYDTGFDRCLENLANGNVPESPHVEAETSEETEENTKKYYEALFASQKPLHVNTDVTQLDAIARLLAFKCATGICAEMGSMNFWSSLAAFCRKGTSCRKTSTF